MPLLISAWSSGNSPRRKQYSKKMKKGAVRKACTALSTRAGLLPSNTPCPEGSVLCSCPASSPHSVLAGYRKDICNKGLNAS